MTNKEARYALMQHYAKELSCCPDDFLNDANKIIQTSDPDDPFLQMRCFGRAVIMKVDPRIADWCAAFVSRHPGFRCFDSMQFTQIYHEVQRHSFILFGGEGAIADLAIQRPVIEPGKTIKLIEKADLPSFFENEIHAQAFPMTVGDFSDKTELLAAEYLDGQVAGVACADRQSDLLADIGCEVKEEYRQRGIGTRLSLLITNELLRRGLLPFAQFAWSNIASKSILYRCGYYPAWAYANSEIRN